MSLMVLNGSRGLFVTAQVYLLYRFIEAATGVVKGEIQFPEAILWAIALVGLNLLQHGINLISNTTADRFQERLRGHIEEQCYRKVQSVPLSQLETPALHDQLQRARRGIERRLFSTMSFLWRSVSDVVALASLLIYLASFHWALPLILVVGTSPGVFLRERVNRARYLMVRDLTPDERRFDTYHEILSGRKAAAEIRMFAFGAWLIDRADVLWRKLSGRRMRLAKKEARLGLISDGLNTVTYIVAVTFSLGLLFAGRATIGAYAAFFYAIEQLQGHYRSLVWGASIIYNDLRYVQDYFEFVDRPSGESVKSRPLSKNLQTGIFFQDVSFVYPGSDLPAISNLNLNIRPGERIAVVGENGAGKSTLVKLILGLFNPTTGRILVDGVDLREVAPNEWLRRTGVVFQDYNRYELTVRENIVCGWLEGASGAVEEAAAKSGADDVAETLSRGLETPLGKTYRRGTELSIGQWQKLAIARAYMRPADILILDEPASALDARAEADVYSHFARIAHERTVLLISHRLGSCRLAHRILLLGDGKIVEEGSHQELLAMNGQYAELYRNQAQWYQ
ncbi:MAG: ABC transporter ATP-binding protein [Candidatus Latescibacteria bacterium]|nr:ABC transporter ATP-binding protein [Candidatus Latescibacterota bacterium]